MITNDINGILADSQADLANRFHLCRVAADAATDARDEELARGLRWLADAGRQPLLDTGWWDKTKWCWCGFQDGSRLPEGKGWRDYAHHLPYDVYRRMPGSSIFSYVKFATFPEAVIAAARAAGKSVRSTLTPL